MKEVQNLNKSDWRASFALLLFSYTPARHLTSAQFSYISCKWNLPEETLTLLDCGS